MTGFANIYTRSLLTRMLAHRTHRIASAWERWVAFVAERLGVVSAVKRASLSGRGAAYLVSVSKLVVGIVVAGERDSTTK